MQFWNEMEGQTIAGEFQLQQLIRSEGRRAWFETRNTGPQAEPATISISEALTDADEIESRLKAAERLDNPNLVILNHVGRTSIGHTLFVFALMEHIDQDLFGLLQNRPLASEEAQQVALSLANALTAIHSQGMFHGRVEPASVLAIGEKVKLRSDCLGSPGGSQAGDISALGTTIYQSLMQRKPSGPTDPGINRLPAPFAEIVRNALNSRWGLEQIVAVLQPASAPAAPRQDQEKTPLAGGAGAHSAAASIPAAAHTSARKPPSAESTDSKVSPSPADPSATADPGKPASSRLALYVIVGVLIAFLLGWLIVRPRKTTNPVTNPSRLSNEGSTSPPDASPHPPPRARDLQSPRPGRQTGTQVTVPFPRAQPDSAKTNPQSTSDRSTWHVVAYTYFHQDQALQKASEINQAHPELKASVFSAHEGRGPYLVIIGGSMDRPQAFAMRQKARSMGLPSDTYAQNFSH